MSDPKLAETPKATEGNAVAGGIILLKGFWSLLVILFAVFVGTPLVLNLVEYGASWQNVPWLILIFALLVKR